MGEAFDWTEERIELLRQRWAEGVPTAAIGRELGVSKNAAVGKARRVGCEARPSPIRAPAGSPQARRPKRAPLVTLALNNSGAVGGATALQARVSPSVTAPESGKVFAAEKSQEPRAHRCEWLFGTRGHYVRCDKPAARPRVYCVQHCAEAYVPFRARAAE